MTNLKQPRYYEEQLDILKNHHMNVENDDVAIEILKSVNYYRLSGYALAYRKNPDQSDFVEDTSFNTIFKIYEFDREMRNLLLRYIEITEIYFRTKISYGFSIAKCMDPPHDQHYDEKNYYNKNGFNGIKNSFKREKERYKDSLIVKHHTKKYQGKMPLWVMVDLLSFSNLSKLYSCMYNSEQDTIAADANTGRKTLENHLHCLSVLRNKCAHAARLYDSVFYPPARFSRAFLAKTNINKDTLFAYVIVLHRRLPDDHTRKQFITDLDNLFGRYEEFIDLSQMGFHTNWISIITGQKH